LKTKERKKKGMKEGKKERNREEEKDVCIYIRKERERKNNKAPRLSRCIRSFKRIQDQYPYSSFQPCAIR
jgi:hypothetical protein